MRSGLALSCSIAACLALATTSARATTAEPVRLVYELGAGIEGCPDGEGLRGAVATRLGYDPFHEESKRQLTARITRTGRELRAEIVLRESSGEIVGSRSLTDRTCADLASAMAFAISMAIDPVHALAPLKPDPPAAPAPAIIEPSAPSPVTRDEPAPPPRPPEATGPPFVPRIHAGGGLSGLGPVAGLTPLLTIGGGVRYGAAALDLEGHYLPPSSEAVTNGRVRTSTLGVALLPCAYVDPLFFCGEVTLGALQGEAEGVDAPDKATTVFVQAGARIGVAIVVARRVTIEPFVDGLATLTRTRINFRGQEVWSTSGFGLSGGARVAVHFP